MIVTHLFICIGNIVFSYDALTISFICSFAFFTIQLWSPYRLSSFGDLLPRFSDTGTNAFVHCVKQIVSLLRAICWQSNFSTFCRDAYGLFCLFLFDVCPEGLLDKNNCCGLGCTSNLLLQISKVASTGWVETQQSHNTTNTITQSKKYNHTRN